MVFVVSALETHDTVVTNTVRFSSLEINKHDRHETLTVNTVCRMVLIRGLLLCFGIIFIIELVKKKQ